MAWLVVRGGNLVPLHVINSRHSGSIYPGFIARVSQLCYHLPGPADHSEREDMVPRAHSLMLFFGHVWRYSGEDNKCERFARSLSQLESKLARSFLAYSSIDKA